MYRTLPVRLVLATQACEEDSQRGNVRYQCLSHFRYQEQGYVEKKDIGP